MYTKSYNDMQKVLQDPSMLRNISKDKTESTGLASRLKSATASTDVGDPASGLDPAPELMRRMQKYKSYTDNAAESREQMMNKIKTQQASLEEPIEIEDDSITSSSETLMPKPNNNNNTSLIDFIIGEEGFREKAYWDVKQYTIGYGTKAKSANETITKEEALKRLNEELEVARKAVSDLEKGYAEPFTTGQKNALISFTYNAGQGNLKKLTDNGTRGIEEIGDMILEYVYADGKKLPGLVKRRKREYELFNEGN